MGKPNADGSATFAATLSNPKPNGQAKFVYPATLHNGEGGIDESQLLNNQNGLLNTSATNISKNFDAATGTGILSVSGSTATINGNIGMKNEVCICKIMLSFADENGISDTRYSAGNTLNIYVGDGRKYTITSAFQNEYAVGTTPVYLPFKTNDVIYVAMLPVTSQPILFTSTNSSSGKTYATSVFGSLEAGKFYRNVDVAMNRGAGCDLRNGSITAGNGSIITSGGVQTANTITIPDGATVMLYDVNINANNSAGIICQGTATIILEGTNSIVSTTAGYPGIQPGPLGTTLTIRGSGSLTAAGGDGAAGIGSGTNGSCGNITIMGGIIWAGGGPYAAGIGCGQGGYCGNITITNTVTRVTAHKGNLAPYSIGGEGGSGRCGTIIIGGTTYYSGSVFYGNGQTKLSRASFTYEP